MAECATKPTYTKDNNGLITWTNPNTVPVTITSLPALAGFPLTIAANTTGSATVTVPGESEGAVCYEFTYDCADETGTQSKTLSVTAPDGPYAAGQTIVHTATVTNTGTESLSVTFTAHGQTYGPITVASGQVGTQSIPYTVTTADANNGSVTCVVQAQCVGDSGTINQSDSVTSTVLSADDCSVQITSVTLNPDKAEYLFGEQVEVCVIATNTGNVDLDNFIVDLEHPTFDPRLCCPSEPITDISNFTLMWKHEEFPNGVFQTNVDGAITINGVAYDIGQSAQYSSAQPGVFTQTYDLTNVLPAGPYSGPAILSASFWYNGLVNPQPMTIDGDSEFFECSMQISY